MLPTRPISAGNNWVPAAELHKAAYHQPGAFCYPNNYDAIQQMGKSIMEGSDPSF
jgi:hypothetical protein